MITYQTYKEIHYLRDCKDMSYTMIARQRFPATSLTAEKTMG